MFKDDFLNEYIKNADTIHTQSQIIAEWNLNIFDNIAEIGNYRYRPSILSPIAEELDLEQSLGDIKSTYVKEDMSMNPRINNLYTYDPLETITEDPKELLYYQGATDADITVDGGYNEQNIPTIFTSKKEKHKMLYSLEDCFKRFRPRSGINKILYFSGRYFNSFRSIDGANIVDPDEARTIFNRPRYYIGSRDDNFKYWTSYRTEQSRVDAYIQPTKIRLDLINSKLIVTVDNSYTKGDYVSISDSRSFGLSVKDDGTIDGTNRDNWMKYKDEEVVDSLPDTESLDPLFFLPLPIEPVIETATSTQFTIAIPKSIIDEIKALLKSEYTDRVGHAPPQLPTKLGLALHTLTGSSGLDVNDLICQVIPYAKEVGISRDILATGKNYIDDAAPFVVYKNEISANRIVVKMQTNVSDINLGPYRSSSGTEFEDPFYESTTQSNKTVPDDWKVQALHDNEWVTLKNSEGEDLILDDSVIGVDGYVELAYGLVIPEVYREKFVFADSYSIESEVPLDAPEGYAFFVQYGIEKGFFKIRTEEGWGTFEAGYGWYVDDKQPTRFTNYVTDMVDTPYFADEDDNIFYREIEKMQGLRVVVKSMNKPGQTFDLIEISPRLVVDLTEKTTAVSVSKGASDLGISGLPVGQILVSKGNISIFDYDNAFNQYNPLSILNTTRSDGSLYTLSSNNLQFKIYDVVYDDDGMSYHIPVKTMYADGFPEINSNNRSVSIKLRDLFFLFETTTAPELLLSKASLSFVIASLLDSVGFSNYVFWRSSSDNEPIIPHFFTGTNVSVAEVLQDIAVSTQTAMFFDEYNNLVVMSKEFLLPSEEDPLRQPQLVLSGSKDSGLQGIHRNMQNDGSTKSNIIEISSQTAEVFNAGKITYSTRDIQKSYGTLQQAEQLDSEKVWGYKPVLLWEVAGGENTKPYEDGAIASQSGFALSAIPLKTSLSENLPYIDSDGVIQDNTFDLGESVYWMPRYNGYFYANGEIIKFDATEYSITSSSVTNISAQLVAGTKTVVLSYGTTESMKPGQLVQKSAGSGTFGNDAKVENILSNNTFTVDVAHATSGDTIFRVVGASNVWIKSAKDYRNYFSKLSFNGKIFPTGRVRIFTEPYYQEGMLDVLKPYLDSDGTYNEVGGLAKTGRAQFGTKAVSHQAGISSDWEDADKVNRRACQMASKYLFSGGTIPNTKKSGAAGVASSSYYASNSGIIRTMLAAKYVDEDNLKNKAVVDQPGQIQASALVMSGPEFQTGDKAIDYISYTSKEFSEAYSMYGTRMRIIGGEIDQQGLQSPSGSVTYIQTTNTSDDGETETVKASGSSGGLGIFTNKLNNLGYYFEIVALTDMSVMAFTGLKNPINNVFFYKIERESGKSNAIPINLWSGQTQILTDGGGFTGQSRKAAEQNPTVYDLAVEYKKSGKNLIFTLFVNGIPVAVVTDTDPLPVKNSMSLFIRGQSKVMFENVYALDKKQTENGSKPESNVNDSKISFNDYSQANESFSKFAISDSIQQSFLQGISFHDSPEYRIYYNEFGTIFRELSHMNVKYDKAYPALYSTISPTFNRLQSYAIAGYSTTPYGAEFMVINTTDSTIVLDSTSGNYLRIQGITFTQESAAELTVDEFLSQRGEEQDMMYDGGGSINNARMDQSTIRDSRLTYGKKEFTLEAPYIQDRDSAEDIMSWMISKIMKPRKSVGVKIFANPMIQLGDIVTIDYKDENGNDILSSEVSRFVIYYIEYSRDSSGPSMNLYLSEVL